MNTTPKSPQHFSPDVQHNMQHNDPSQKSSTANWDRVTGRNAENLSALEIKDKVIEVMLPKVSSHGWHWGGAEAAMVELGMDEKLAIAYFPGGIVDVLSHFSDKIDRTMLKSLEKIPYDSLRSKDRIRAAILKRYQILEPYRDAVRFSLSFWTMPNHLGQGQRVLWRTADRMWNWAGDRATDWSRYSKRVTLASILLATTMVWITDRSENAMVSAAFLDRRLDNTADFGKAMGAAKSIIPNIFRQTLRGQGNREQSSREQTERGQSSQNRF